MSLIFLSHSSIDTESATTLKKRILATPAAQDHNLKIWLDKDDLVAGLPWQQQIEKAIADSTTFVVYVGNTGIINWIDAEVRIALSRAITDPEYRFIPVLSNSSPEPSELPGFAQQFQGVFKPESIPEQFDKLIKGILRVEGAGQLQIEKEPFFGLRAIDESRNHLFFGRDKEIKALTSLVHSTNLVLVTGDSGSGKSSLVRAGLIPQFRGGAIANLDGERVGETIWHVVTSQPRTKPFEALGNAVNEAAKGLGLSLKDRGTLAEWVACGKIDKVKRALRCDLPPDSTRILLVIDQFEELFINNTKHERKPFIDLILELSAPHENQFNVVLIMRRDYVNLCNSDVNLKNRLELDNRKAYFTLRRMNDDGLKQVVTQPLLLAGVSEQTRNILANEILQDVSDRAGDLALVQMALDETWQAHNQNKDSLLHAYAKVGRVQGAIAQAAERVRNKLSDDEKRYLEKTIIRLVRLGDTGGATRRIATHNEFDGKSWQLIQKLASRDGKRLLLIGESNKHTVVEIAHEALVRAWPYFQNLIQNSATEIRIFDLLINRSSLWSECKEPEESAKHLATGADLENFTKLRSLHRDWLSSLELDFVHQSNQTALKSLKHNRLIVNALKMTSLVLFIALVYTGWMWYRATEAEYIATQEQNKATNAARTATVNESRALTAFSQIEYQRGQFVNAVKLALAAWPRKANSVRPKLRNTIDILGQAQIHLRLFIPMQHEDNINGALFNTDESRILTWSRDGTARLWDAQTGKETIPPMQHESGVTGALFNSDESLVLTWTGYTAHLWDIRTGKETISPIQHKSVVSGALLNSDDSLVLTWSWDGTARLWDSQTGNEAITPMQHKSGVRGALFNSNGSRILTWSWDGTARLWDSQTGKETIPPMQHKDAVSGALFNSDDSRILTWSRDGTARLWDSQTGNEAITPMQHKSGVRGALFNSNESRILTWSWDDTARLWDTQTGKETIPLMLHREYVEGARFNIDGSHILTWSGDGTARLWDAQTGKQILPPMQHKVAVSGAVFNSDESLILTWSKDGTVRLWDAQTSKEVLPPMQYKKNLIGALFKTDDSRILTWSDDDSTVRLWDTQTGRLILPPMQHKDVVSGALFNSDESRILTWSDDGTARLWDIRTGKETIPPIQHKSVVIGALFNSDDSRILTWSWDGTARLWDSQTGNEAIPPMQHKSGVRGALFNSNESRILTWSRDGTARLWDTQTGKETIPLMQHSELVEGARFNFDESRILTWSRDGTARLWDAQTGKETTPSMQHEMWIIGALFNTDESLILTWSLDSTVRLWDARTGKETTPLMQHNEPVEGARFNFDESRILTWSRDGTARLWDSQTGNEAIPPMQHKSGVSGALFNSNESRILTWSRDGTARLWDTQTGKETIPLMLHSEPVEGARFNFDESRILTWSRDGTARLWDSQTGNEILLPMKHLHAVIGAKFNANESHILTWSADGTTRLWDVSLLPKGNIINVACERLRPEGYLLSDIEGRFNIKITEPICQPHAPDAIWSELVH